MLPFLILYTLLGMIILAGNLKTGRSYWFLMIFFGFLSANLGLAFYTEFSSGAALYKGLSPLLWRLNYILNLELFDIYRIINAGVVLYAAGALFFAMNMLPDPLLKRKKVLVLAGGLLFFLLFDPAVMRLLLSIDDSPYRGQTVTTAVTNLLRAWNLTGSLVVKGALIWSMALTFRNYRKVIPVNKARLKMTIISMIPIHLVFLVLFYWYPNIQPLYTRYAFLGAISIPTGGLFHIIMNIVASLAVLGLTYSLYHFRVLQMNTQRRELTFSTRVNTAEQGMKIFSHSIKNQFIAARLLSQGIAEGRVTDADKIREDAARIEGICAQAIEQLGRLTRRSGTLSLDYSREDLSVLCKEVASEYSLKYREWSFPFKGERGMILIDRVHLQEVLRNLLTNAMEAAEEHSLQEVRIRQSFHQDYAVITVTDRGRGIDEKLRRQLFNPFFTTKPSISNWGLGLSYCRNVLEAFGGSIEIDSREGEGTTVSLYLVKGEREG